MESLREELNKPTISLLYTTARPGLINEVRRRWLCDNPSATEMVVVTDEPIFADFDCRVRFEINSGRRDCVTGWNLAAKCSTGDILIQVSDDLFPPQGWDLTIRNIINDMSKNRDDIVLNLLDERMIHNAVYHPILTRATYDKLSYIYPPDFESMFCDNWFYAYHQKYSHYYVSNDVFWHHRHRTTHNVVIDDVMRIHESPERYSRGRETFLKYVLEHNLSP